MTIPLISKYALSLGASLTVAGVAAAMMSIAALVCRPITGYASDTMNRKVILLISIAVSAVTIVVNAFVKSITVLMVIRVVNGITFSFMSIANMTLASSLIPRERIGTGIGYLSLGMVFATAVGPGLGLELTNRFGYGTAFLIAAVIMVLGGAAVCLIPNEASRPAVKPDEKRKPLLSNLFAKELLGYMLLLVLLSFGNGLIATYIALLGEERGIVNIALFFIVYSAVVTVIRPPIGSLLDRKGLSVILYPSLAIAALGMIFVGSAYTLWMIVIASVLKAVGLGAGIPSIQANSIKMVGKERAGVATSTCFIGQDIGNSLAPIVGGMVATAHGYGFMFHSYGIALFVLGTVIYSLQLRFDKKKARP